MLQLRERMGFVRIETCEPLVRPKLHISGEAFMSEFWEYGRVGFLQRSFVVLSVYLGCAIPCQGNTSLSFVCKMHFSIPDVRFDN